MSCPWLDGLWRPEYSVYVMVGKPGMGKTTAALHLVAYDLLRRGLASDYQDALKEAGKALFLGRDLEELFEYIHAHVDNPEADWLIIDDAAVGFHDFADPVVWALFVDIIKTARNSVARRGVIFTTTSLRYLSARIVHSANVYYVKKDYLNVKTYNAPAGCLPAESKERLLYTAVVEVDTTLEGYIHFAYWHEAERKTRWKLAAAIPHRKEFAMPPEVEQVHVKARKERVKKAAEEALERIRKKKAEE